MKLLESEDQKGLIIQENENDLNRIFEKLKPFADDLSAEQWEALAVILLDERKESFKQGLTYGVEIASGLSKEIKVYL